MTQKKKIKVYMLFDLDEPDHARYIGQCKSCVDRRVSGHFKDAANDTENRHVCNWIKSINFNVGYRILEEDAIWNESEIKWIAKLKAEGHKLTNMTDGGEGSIGCKRSEEFKRKLSIARKGKKRPEISEKVSKALLGKKHSKERIRQNSISHKGLKISKEHILKLREGLRKWHISKNHIVKDSSTCLK